MIAHNTKAPRGAFVRLEVELLYDFVVSGLVLALQILEVCAAVGDHLEESTA